MRSLEEIDRSISDRIRRIKEQQERISEMQRRGGADDATASADLLATFTQFLAVMEYRRETLLLLASIATDDADRGLRGRYSDRHRI